MANALAWRLKRLEAFREVSGQLMGRPQLQRDVFQRGDPEPIADIKHPQWTATLYDLLSAYAKQRSQAAFSHVQFKKRSVWALQEARENLQRVAVIESEIGGRWHLRMMPEVASLRMRRTRDRRAMVQPPSKKRRSATYASSRLSLDLARRRFSERPSANTPASTSSKNRSMAPTVILKQAVISYRMPKENKRSPIETRRAERKA